MTAHTLLAITFCSVASPVMAGQYDDLVAWAMRDKASSHQFIADLSHCKNAHEVALAVRASATRQHKLTTDLIELVHHHAELRYVPELGLTNEQFHTWAEAHPEAAAKRAALPKDPIKISADLRGYTASLQNAPEYKPGVKVFAQYKDDPDVIVVSRELRAVLDDNGKRLMATFK